MKRTLSVALTLISLNLSCVTVNVNFPDSAVQEATDDYVRDLYKSKPKSSNSSLWDWLIPSALAQESPKNFKIRVPETEAITQNLAARAPRILGYKSRGLLGESKDGMLVVKGKSDLLQEKLKTETEQENADRKKLYSILAKTNNTSETQVAVFFANSFRNQSPSGTWYESRDGEWTQKP